MYKRDQKLVRLVEELNKKMNENTDKKFLIEMENQGVVGKGMDAIKKGMENVKKLIQKTLFGKVEQKNGESQLEYLFRASKENPKRYQPLLDAELKKQDQEEKDRLKKLEELERQRIEKEQRDMEDDKSMQKRKAYFTRMQDTKYAMRIAELLSDKKAAFYMGARGESYKGSASPPSEEEKEDMISYEGDLERKRAEYIDG